MKTYLLLKFVRFGLYFFRWIINYIQQLSIASFNSIYTVTIKRKSAIISKGKKTFREKEYYKEISWKSYAFWWNYFFFFKGLLYTSSYYYFWTFIFFSSSTPLYYLISSKARLFLFDFMVVLMKFCVLTHFGSPVPSS